MKKLLSCLLFHFSIPFLSAQNIYSAYAQQWYHEFLLADAQQQMPDADLQAVRELIEVSADRARVTLQAQEAALDMLIFHWHAWQNLSHTRLNPSHERPFVPDYGRIDHQQYLELMIEQEVISARYAQVAQQVVHGNLLTHERSKKAVDAMRAQARIFMVDALADVKKQLGGLYDIAFRAVHEYADAETDAVQEPAVRGFNFGEFILSYVPNLAMHSFIHADKAHNMISAEGWQVLEKVQRIGNQVWCAIETARLAFYDALLHELDAH